MSTIHQHQPIFAKGAKPFLVTAAAVIAALLIATAFGETILSAAAYAVFMLGWTALAFPAVTFFIGAVILIWLMFPTDHS